MILNVAKANWHKDFEDLSQTGFLSKEHTTQTYLRLCLQKNIFWIASLAVTSFLMWNRV